MRQAEQIMKEFANEHSYETWDELMYDSHGHIQIEYTKEVLHIYAKEVIEECAKRARLMFFLRDNEVDKKSILSLIKELK